MTSINQSHLVIALPALNEEATIGDVLSKIPGDICGIASITILVVNDGSDDNTEKIAKKHGAYVINHHGRRGVGAAFQTAVRFAIQEKADYLATLDSDGQFNPLDLSLIVEPVAIGKADFATASRFKDANLIPQMPTLKIWGNRQMSRLISSLTGQKFYDVSCGMRCYSRKAFLNLNLVGDFTYTQEVFLNLAFKKMSIAEVPVRIRGEREFGKSRVAGSVLRYAINSSRIIWRAYRDFQPFRFFGGISLLLAIPAGLLAGFLGIHYLSTGKFSPHKWAGFTAAAFAVFSLMMFYAGMIGDMLVRHRIYLEELLFLSRERMSERAGVNLVRQLDSRNQPHEDAGLDLAREPNETADVTDEALPS